MDGLNPLMVSPLTLAYLGDAVLELLVRDYLVGVGGDKVAKLNEMARDFVTAKSQSAAVEVMLPLLDEEEADVFRRGRNISHLTAPKSASAAEYRRATGLECLFGYLHLVGRDERVRELFKSCFLCDNNENIEEVENL